QESGTRWRHGRHIEQDTGSTRGYHYLFDRQPGWANRLDRARHLQFAGDPGAKSALEPDPIAGVEDRGHGNLWPASDDRCGVATRSYISIWVHSFLVLRSSGVSAASVRSDQLGCDVTVWSVMVVI